MNDKVRNDRAIAPAVVRTSRSGTTPIRIAVRVSATTTRTTASSATIVDVRQRGARATRVRHAHDSPLGISEAALRGSTDPDL